MSAADEVRRELLGEFRATAAQRIDRIVRGWLAAEEHFEVSAVNAVLGELHSLKGESRMMGFDAVATLLHRLEELTFAARDRAFDLPRGVGDEILSAFELALVAVAQEPSAPPPPEVATWVAKLERLQLSQYTEASAGTSATPASSPAALPKESEAATMVRNEALAAFSEGAWEILSAQSRVVDGLNALRTRLRDLASVLDEGKLDRDAARGFTDQVRATLGHLEEEAHAAHLEAQRLESAAQQLRMVPVATLFRTSVRAAREAARQLDKQVAIVIDAGEVRVDGQVLARLREPLMHLVNNAVDHGIENAEARRARGKSEKATVRLAAAVHGNRIRIAVEDDGGGVDLEAVRQRAIAAGLLDAARTTPLSVTEAANLMFSPGFTTRGTATQTSGRGLGLDVVKRVVEQLGGGVTLSTSTGHGTRFEMDVPGILSLTRLMVVRHCGSVFAVPSQYVVRALQIERQAIALVDGHWTIPVDGRRVPCLDLARVWGGAAKVGDISAGLLIEVDGRRVALSVEKCSEEVELIVRPLREALTKSRVLLGVTVLAGGELGLVLSPHGILRRALGEEIGVRATADLEPPTNRQRRILLVEDSSITRAMLKRLLTDMGYAVTEAEDGARALAQVAEQSFDLVLTDLDMPNVTGFELIERLRREERFRRLPIVVLSTRGLAEDRARASELGADAYLVKTDFGEAELRRVVSELI